MIFKKKMFDWYLAGRMRGIKDFNFPEFDRIAKQIRKQGYTVFSPAENNPVTRTFEECMKVDLNAIINNCKSIALLPQWRLSTGANVEVFVGNACGRGIYEIEERIIKANLSYKTACDSWNDCKISGTTIIFNKLDEKKYQLPYENFESRYLFP